MEAAFFDLDKTIISRSSSLALSGPTYRAGIVRRGQLVRRQPSRRVVDDLHDGASDISGG